MDETPASVGAGEGKYSFSPAWIERTADGSAEGIAEGKADGVADGNADGKIVGKAEGIDEGTAEGNDEGRADGDSIILVDPDESDKKAGAEGLAEG